MSDRISVSSLSIEVTRRCNIQCAHCMRGEPQGKDINLAHVEKLFQKIGRIETLTFSGGEPSLKVAKIKGILELAKKYNVEVENFYIATNGVNNDVKFASVCMEWYVFCTENTLSSVDVSYDEFHQNEAYVDFDSTYLSSLKFSKKRDAGRVNFDSLVKSGRSTWGEPRTEEKFRTEIWGDGTISVFEGNLYLNALGKLIAGCDWSYEDQEEYVIGDCDSDVAEWALSTLEETIL